MVSTRSQAAIDFMTSYGIALLFLTIALYVIFQLGVFNFALAPQYCYSTGSLSCIAYTMNSNSMLTVLLTQSTGGVLNVTGAACSSTPNSTNIGPMYGNVKLLPYKTPTNALYYPNNGLQGGLLIYPSSSVQLTLYCYNSGGEAKSSLGQLFTGYVWLNYTYSNLPSNNSTIQQALSLSVRYT